MFFFIANATAIRSRKQMELCPSSDQKNKEAAQAIQHYKHAASVNITCPIGCFQVSRQKQGRQKAVNSSQETFP